MLSQSPLISSFNKAALPISQALLGILNSALSKHPELIEGHYILHFSNKHYCAEQGGYHPIEVTLTKDGHNVYSILCITDFSFNGYPYPTLERDIEFDFIHSAVFTRYSGIKSMSSPNIVKLYALWESTFIANFREGAYNLIELRSH
ncbi:DUF2787 family protein [uncultured Vibrio sp.]|uniref:DUF2787 family protein n=1 Tax=uncultured Vibrio sp. TaxID=114054 RepID=UPI00261F8625|nr:DUF2787 family protein [uncultured Vibrio sp.]